jgi:uncharacterized membrane protein
MTLSYDWFSWALLSAVFAALSVRTLLFLVGRTGHRCFMGLLLSPVEGSDASKVAPVDKLGLLLIAVFASIFLHER